MSARRARWALGVGVTAISFAAIFFKRAQPTPPLVAAGIRLALAAILLAPFVVRAHIRRAWDAPLIRSALLGGSLYAVHFGAWVASLELISVAASVTLVTATPLFLALVALGTGRDRPTLRLGAAIVVALLGVGLIGAAESGGGALSGNTLALLGAIAMGLFMLVVRRHPKLDVLAFTGVACGVGALLLLSAATLLGDPLLPPTPLAWRSLVLAALVPQLIGHGCLAWSLRELTPTTVGLATVAEPVGATLLAWLWLGEEPGALALAGCAVVLVAVAIALRATPRPPVDPSPGGAGRGSGAP